MEPSFWHARWEEDRHGFHQERVHPTLLERIPQLASSSPLRVLVPLAGKTWDVHWLATEGHHVTAIELSERAVQQFHHEQGRQAVRTETPPYTLYSSPNCRYLVGDVFDVKPEIVGEIDLIWDRAALVALDPARRDRYAPTLLQLLRPGGILLLNTFRYPPNAREGPPHSIEEHEVMRHFGAECQVELLESKDRIDEEIRWKSLGFTSWIASTWKITKRG